MPMPQAYFHASRDFEMFMEALKRISMLQTTHQCYTMLEAVLHAFRAHLTAREALAFAHHLPPVIRAIFVDDWDMDQPVSPFPDRAGLQREILALRNNHNLSTPTAMEDVAAALRETMDGEDFARMIAVLPEAGAALWR